MKKILTYLLLACSLLLPSCVSDCYVPQKARMGMIFYNKTDNSEHQFTSFNVKGVGSDSLLYNGSTASKIYLPLKANDDTTSFECSYTVVVDETTSYSYPFNIKVAHTPMPQLISEECGCVMFQTVNNVWFEGEVSANWEVVIYNPNVTNVENDIHVQIYIP